MVNSVAKLLQV